MREERFDPGDGSGIFYRVWRPTTDVYAAWS